MRVKKGVTARRKHKKILKDVKGMQHNRTRSFRLAKQARIRALEYSYRDRRNKKRNLRSLWITRINNSLRQFNQKYSTFIAKMKQSKVELDRKMLAELAVNEPKAFEEVIKTVTK